MAVCRYSPNVSTAAPCASVKTQTGPGVHPKNINGQQASSDFRLAILNAHRAECKVELLQEELQTMTERCARLGDLEAKNSLLKAELAQARDESSQLAEESEVLREQCLALEQLLLEARNESRADDETSLASGSSLDAASGRSNDFFYPGLEHSEPLQPETSAATLTPPPRLPQPVFPIYYTGDTLVCLEAESATAKAPAKAVTATKAAAKKAATATKTAAVKAAKSIRKAASAMAHMRFHH
ncbi:hypothetical protein H4S06_006036 [Coemansia sp. BCRC 34490]|nr:hypothetical protein H4S06_006036 [Coemansia sp. BCRC 34490]